MPRRRPAPRPRAHWGLLLLVQALSAAGLLLSGFATHRTGASTTPSGPAAEPGLPERTGPILDLSDGSMRSIAPPAGTVVLTFDDGPDPRWTPEILDILEAEDVPATFFVLGARVGEQPGLARRIHDEGHEIGVHTFSHRDVTTARPWERDLEMSLTQAELAGAVGIRSSLFRPPYSSTPEVVTEQARQALQPIADDGYLIVLSSRDSRDWERPGVPAIVEAATPAHDQGAVILFHDGGGDRSQTVAALRRLIPALKERGVRFATVSDTLAGTDAAGAVATTRPVGTGRRVASLALVALQQASGRVAVAVEWLFVPIGVLALLRGVAVAVLARRHASGRRAAVASSAALPPVSIVVPAYDEEVGIAAAVTSLARSDHPEVEVIVVDDGSTDGTADVVRSLGLPNVTVIRQANTGKPGALDTGIAHAAHDIVVTVDGDTVFQPDTVGHLVRPLADPKVGAVSGNTKVANRTGLLGRWQHVEYVMGFNLDRRMYEQLDCMPTVPGAIGAFRRDALQAVGGVSDDTLAEDTDLTMAINRAGWRVVYEEDAIAWTEAPATLSGLWRQRYRWSFGTMQAMWKHRGAVLDREHPGVGRRALPYLLLFQVLLPLLAPLVDLWAVYGLVFLDPWRVAAAWLAFTLVQLATAVYAFRLDREPLWPLWSLPIQQVVYRQLMYLVVIQSVVTAVLGVCLPWQRIERTGAINTPA